MKSPTFYEKIDMWEKMFRTAIEWRGILESPISLKYEAMLELISVARRSIPIPIAQAPKDGTLIDLICKDGERIVDVSFYRGRWRIPGGDEIDAVENGIAVSWLPVPQKPE